MEDERHKGFRDGDELNYHSTELAREQRRLDALKQELEALPRGEDPKIEKSWVDGVWDLGDRDDGRWMESVKHDPIRIAWEQKASEIALQQRQVDFIATTVTGLVEDASIKQESNAAFIQRALRLDGTTIGGGKLWVDTNSISFSGDGFNVCLWEQGQWTDPSRKNLLDVKKIL